MTILGTWLDAGARAVMWADTETVMQNGSSGGHVNKVSVNAAAGLACIQAGWHALGLVAHEVACDAATFDEAVGRMPRRLRVEAARLVSRPRTDPRAYGHQTVIVAGFSADLGCVAAFEFNGDAYFGPVMVSDTTWPVVPGPRVLNGPGDVVEVARVQAAEMRKEYPHIGCGRLTIAVVERDRVACHAPYNLTDGAWLQGPFMKERNHVPA